MTVPELPAPPLTSADVGYGIVPTQHQPQVNAPQVPAYAPPPPSYSPVGSQPRVPGTGAVTIAPAFGQKSSGWPVIAIVAVVVGGAVAVMIVVGIAAAIAIPVFLNQRAKAEAATVTLSRPTRPARLAYR